MAAKEATSIEVEIYGNVFQVRGDYDRKHLLELASVVDRKMREIGSHGSTVDSGKLAILAALNLADELHQCSSQQEDERDQFMDKVSDLTGTLARVLEEGS